MNAKASLRVLLQQQVGSNPRSIKLYKEMRKAEEEKQKAAQHDGHPEVCDGRTPILPDGGTGTLPEHMTAVRLVGVVGGVSFEVVGREARLTDATPTIPDGVLADPSTIPQPQCEVTHHQNLVVTVMQPESMQEPGNNNDRISIKRAKISIGATVRWKRSRKQEVREATEEGDTGQEESIRYRSKFLSCTKCCEPQETRWMQLRQKTGYRDMHCPASGKHERCSHNRCIC